MRCLGRSLSRDEYSISQFTNGSRFPPPSPSTPDRSCRHRQPGAGTVIPVNVYGCFAPSSVNYQPAGRTDDEPLFVIVTVSPFRSRAVIETEPDDAGTELCC